MHDFISQQSDEVKYREPFFVPVDELVVSEPHPEKEVVDFFVREMQSGMRMPPVEVKRLDDGKFAVVIGKARAIASMMVESRADDEKLVRCRMYEYKNLIPIFNSIQRSSGDVNGLFFRIWGYKFLKMTGMTGKEISRKCKRNMDDLIKCMIVDSMPCHIKKLILNGTLSPSLAVVVVKKFGAHEAHRAITKASNDPSLWEGKRITPRMIMNHID